MLLSVSGLVKKFERRGREFAAVNEVSLQVDAGEFIAIVGRSGNGKTTLLNLITGLLTPSEGTVSVSDKDIVSASDKEISQVRNQLIGFVSQGHSLLANLTVIDNVLLPACLYREKGDPKLFNRALELLDRLEIRDLYESYPGELSGGEIRRVAIARALINNPVLFIADEPTSDLDEDSAQIVLTLLRELADQGTAVIIVTHDSEAAQCADKIYRMEAGKCHLEAEHK